MRGHQSSTFLVQRKKALLQLSKYSFFEVFFFLAPLIACNPLRHHARSLHCAASCFCSLRGQEHLSRCRIHTVVGAFVVRLEDHGQPADSCVRHQAVHFCLISERWPVASTAPDLRLPTNDRDPEFRGRREGSVAGGKARAQGTPHGKETPTTLTAVIPRQRRTDFHG